MLHHSELVKISILNPSCHRCERHDPVFCTIARPWIGQNFDSVAFEKSSPFFIFWAESIENLLNWLSNWLILQRNYILDQVISKIDRNVVLQNDRLFSRLCSLFLIAFFTLFRSSCHLRVQPLRSFVWSTYWNKNLKLNSLFHSFLLRFFLNKCLFKNKFQFWLIR